MLGQSCCVALNSSKYAHKNNKKSDDYIKTVCLNVTVNFTFYWKSQKRNYFKIQNKIKQILNSKLVNEKISFISKNQLNQKITEVNSIFTFKVYYYLKKKTVKSKKYASKITCCHAEICNIKLQIWFLHNLRQVWPFIRLHKTNMQNANSKKNNNNIFYSTVFLSRY